MIEAYEGMGDAYIPNKKPTIFNMCVWSYVTSNLVDDLSNNKKIEELAKVIIDFHDGLLQGAKDNLRMYARIALQRGEDGVPAAQRALVFGS